MAKSKKVDPIKQREKRAKIAAAIGGLLFLGVAAIEIPSMMSALNKKPPPGANATDAGNRAPDGSILLPNVSVSSGLTGNGQLADTDVPPQSDAGQLVSFSVFQTKNPFVAQVSADGATEPAAAAAPATVGKGADVPPTATTATPTATPPTSTVSVVPPTTPTPAPTATTPTGAPPPTVTIAVNGTASRVAAQGTFPSASPVFRLVSFTSDSAQVAIVGGSYATGVATLTLHLGQPVTLENQTDGKLYKLELVATH
jgi:hypothetical protein